MVTFAGDTRYFLEEHKGFVCTPQRSPGAGLRLTCLQVPSEVSQGSGVSLAVCQGKPIQETFDCADTGPEG